MTPSATPARRIPVFFYGSFIRPDVMARGGLHPDRVEVARLDGFDIRIDPHASISRSPSHAICGIVVQATHDELGRLYAQGGVGVFLPEAVVVSTADHRLLPALCYISPAHGGQPPDLDYLARLVAAGRAHGFPAWYLDRLEALVIAAGDG